MLPPGPNCAAQFHILPDCFQLIPKLGHFRLISGPGPVGACGQHHRSAGFSRLTSQSFTGWQHRFSVVRSL